MGRIAEALKRAQQERDQRCHEAFAVLTDPARSAPPQAAGPDVPPTDPGPGAAAVRHPSSFLDAPPLPEAIPVHAAPILPDAIDRRVVTLHEPASDISEKYRSIRTRLLTGNPTGSTRAFAVTSALRKEGRTVTTSNLGFSMAELRHLRVAMIDLDFRQRGLSRQFCADDRPGAAEVLRGEKRLAEVCVPAVRENLFFIPAGDPAGVGPSELLVGASVAAVFRELNERFHYTLIDTPPVSAAADLGLIAPLCHSVLIVIRMNRTPESLLCRCVKLLQASGVSIAGCILAGYREPAMGWDTHDYYEAAP